MSYHKTFAKSSDISASLELSLSFMVSDFMEVLDVSVSQGQRSEEHKRASKKSEIKIEN